ncbi:MAG TPA: PEP-CTERM sorting domain-containing protein [Chthoniobacterales bacterium]
MKSLLLIVPILVTLAGPLCAQHSHLNAGIIDANHNGIADAGERLAFVNGATFNTASGYALSLTWKTTGDYAGTFSGNLTFTALAATPDRGGPEADHAALGSHIVVQLVSVSGPTGGTFSFWEDNAVSPTISLGVGAASSPTMRWDLSENNALPGDDPFGHVHGRQFSVDQAGTYTATFQLFDTSTNGPGGGPLHAASDTFQMSFVAVPEPGVLALFAIGAVGAILGGRLRRRS